MRPVNAFKIDLKDQIIVFLAKFEKLSRVATSFAQRNLCRNQKFIVPKFNDMKLVRFEGLAHGEK